MTDADASRAPATASGPASAPEGLPAQPIAIPPGFELPTAREVVGRGLQLTYESTRDIRRASLYVGLLLLATVGPFIFLLLAEIPRFEGITFEQVQALTTEEQLRLVGLIAPLYVTGILALLGLVSVAIDASLICVALLAGRAVGRPMTLREAIGRARQVYWRYGFAAFIVAVISFAVALGLQQANGSLGRPDSVGESILASFVGAIVVLPFSYVATAVVIGDVNGAAALSRSVTLVRARLRLGVTVAAFAFVAGALQTFGLGAGLGVIGDVAQLLHVDLDLGGPGLVVAMALAGLGIVALGSLLLTVDAIAVAPQVAAFLGLTHYDAGLDRARTPVPVAPPESPPDTAPDTDPPSPPASPATYWSAFPAATPKRVRWLTVPMAILVVIEVLVALAWIIQPPAA